MNLDIAILDALADDFESVEQIKNYLVFLGFQDNLNNLDESVKVLLDKGLIFINEEMSDDIFTWYGMTTKGRCLWTEKAKNT